MKCAASLRAKPLLSGVKASVTNWKFVGPSCFFSAPGGFLLQWTKGLERPSANPTPEFLGHQMVLKTNGVNDFNVHPLESCGLNFSENTQELKEQGQRILSLRGICFLFFFLCACECCYCC